jgi:hypothetical protein
MEALRRAGVRWRRRRLEREVQRPRRGRWAGTRGNGADPLPVRPSPDRGTPTISPRARVQPTPLGHPYGQAALAQELARSPTPPRAAATTPSTRPASASTAWSPAASSTTPTSKPACSPPPRPADCWPRNQTRPAARWPPPNEPGGPIPAPAIPQQQLSRPAPGRNRIRQTTRRDDRERDG